MKSLPIAGLLAFAIIASLGISAPPAAPQESSQEQAHIDLYKRVNPSVVGISDRGQKGTGVIVDPQGYILTSTTAVRSEGKYATVCFSNGKTVEAEKVIFVASKEIAIIKVNAKDLPMTAVEIGDSDNIKVGQTSYVIGDSFNSIFYDGQAALSLGTISGIYAIDEVLYPGTGYVGKVIETSAAVNPNQDGAPLLDAEGKLVGLVTLNFTEAKFTGLAVPINVAKPYIEKAKRGERVKEDEIPLVRVYMLGLAFMESPEGPRIAAVVPDSPAMKAGLKERDIVLQIDGKKIKRGREVREYLLNNHPQSIIATVKRQGKNVDVVINLQDEKKVVEW